MNESLIYERARMIRDLVLVKFVEVMEEIYTDRAINEESTGDRTEGKQTIIADEKQVLENVVAFHGCENRSIGVASDDSAGKGVMYAEDKLTVDMKDGGQFNPGQMPVTQWEDGKAKHDCSYYNANF